MARFKKTIVSVLVVGTVLSPATALAQDYKTTVRLKLIGHLVARVKLEIDGIAQGGGIPPPGVPWCAENRTVKIQRWRGGRWRVIGRGATPFSGDSVRISLADKPGRYRALAAPRRVEGDTCRKGISQARKHGRH